MVTSSTVSSTVANINSRINGRVKDPHPDLVVVVIVVVAVVFWLDIEVNNCVYKTFSQQKSCESGRVSDSYILAVGGMPYAKRHTSRPRLAARGASYVLKLENAIYARYQALKVKRLRVGAAGVGGGLREKIIR